MMRFLPISIFAVLLVFFLIGLGINSQLVPSPLIDKTAPALNLPPLEENNSALISTDALLGRVWLLNVWASWCVGCRVEHPYINRLAGEGAYIVGLNYKDETAAAVEWLNAWGNPYQQIAVDAAGTVGLNWGVYGVPETFVIDKQGIIRHKHIGPLTEQDLRDTIRPLLVALRAK